VIVRRAPETSLKQFTPIEKLLLIGEISVTYVVVRRMLRRQTIDQVAETARAGLNPATDGSRSDEMHWFALRLGRVVEKSLERLPGDTRCLTRSVVLVRMLARRGVRSNLVIGVRPAPTFAAHAWVELSGNPLLSPIEYAEGRLVEF
jgi:hypothetical protein